MINRMSFIFLHLLWRILDAVTPKRDYYWAFSTHHIHTGRFIENQRALFEEVKARADIKKIIFYRGVLEDPGIEGAVNYEVLRHGSFRGFCMLARCKVVLLTNSISMDLSLRWGNGQFGIVKLCAHNRFIVNLWHGIPLKKLYEVANPSVRTHLDRVRYRHRERSTYTGLICSSAIDSYAMAAMFYPLRYQQIWLTGLPRNDFLLRETDDLPSYIRKSLDLLNKIKRGRKLIVYAPTYRQTAADSSANYYQFSKNEIHRLRDRLMENNAILGYRPHYFKNNKNYFNMNEFIDDELIFDMSQGVVPEISAVIRECDLLITDYSSVYIDAIYIDKPVVCFAYDLDDYMNHQDGILYDMKLAFPGPVYRDFESVISSICDDMFELKTSSDLRKLARLLFFSHTDSDNSRRVAEKIYSITGM